MMTRQEKLVHLIMDNATKDKPDSTYSLIKQAGYSDDLAEHPKKVLNTRSFQELLNEYVPDDFVLKILQRNMQQTENYMASVKAADVIVRIKGQYAPPKLPVDPLESLGDVEIDDEIKKLEQQKLKRLKQNSTIIDAEIT